MSSVAETIYRELTAGSDQVRREHLNEPELYEFAILHRTDHRAEVRVIVDPDRGCHVNLYAVSVNGETQEAIPLVLNLGDPEMISKLRRQVEEWLSTRVEWDRMGPMRESPNI